MRLYTKPAYAWYVVVLLTLAYVVSYMDRQILALVVGPIKRDLGLSDTQIGLLLGPAFAIFYTTLGVPLGWLADRKGP
jgi:sugar phosphate permease